MAERPSVCVHCGKRLSKKQWYYRNGQFFCKQRCFHENLEKVAGEKLKAAEAKAAEAAKAAETKAAEAVKAAAAPAEAPAPQEPKEGSQPAPASS